LDKANEKGKKGDRQGALRDLEEGLQADPRNFWAYMSRGVIWLQMESYQRAIADATQAIALNPGIQITGLPTTCIIWLISC
jgi:tetratricopeptide (TPR) repeat protein